VENRPYCAVCRPPLRSPATERITARIDVRGARQLPRNRNLL
jgi:hypothetical protein